MCKQIILFILLLNLAACSKSEEPDFNILRFDLNKQKDVAAYESWKKKNQVIQNKTIKDTLKFTDGTVAGTLFYEDEYYKVFTKCEGEFGGSIIFQDKKKKNSLFYMESVCTVMIDRRKEGYYIVESLAHMSGSGRVIFIKSPESLVQLNLNHLTPNWKAKKFPNLSEFEIYQKLKNQAKVLVGGFDVTYNLVFEYKNKNYLIYSKDEKTLLGQIKADTLLPIDTLFHFSSYRALDDYKYKAKNFHHYEFYSKNVSISPSGTDTDKALGEIYVRNNTIICAYSDRHWTAKQSSK